ncbi:MAG: acyltransferase [Promethearchaeota archaeon]
MKNIPESFKRINPNTKLGNHVVIEDFCIIGYQKEKNPNENKNVNLTIGDNSLIRSHSVIYADTIIGDNFTTGHGVLIREHCRIGNNVSVGSHSVIEDHVIIEDNVRIHSNCFIPQNTIIRDSAWIGPSVTFINDPHPPCAGCMKGPEIGKNSKIGGNVTILDHVRIGDNCLIGAGSVIVNDVKDNSVIYTKVVNISKNITDLECKTGKYPFVYQQNE